MHFLFVTIQDRLATVFLGLPWSDIVTKIRKAVRRILRSLVDEGMYEVLEYESTLELQDKRGKRAIFRKREKVLYLQDNIIAYQDQAWGDGSILLNYRCTPGSPVDRYRPGQKTYILISLREVKNKGDIDDFNIEWGIRDGFTRKSEQWETEVRHLTKRLKIQVIFPKTRPPLKAFLKENNRQRTKKLGADSQIQLPDGRHMVVWGTQKPRLYEKYILLWHW